MWVYKIVRPHEKIGEVWERNLAEEALLAEVEAIHHCPTCERRVDEEWIICPTCRTRLNRVCPNCSRLVGLDWSLCAWCGKDFERRESRPRRSELPAVRHGRHRQDGGRRAAAATPAIPAAHAASPSDQRADRAPTSGRPGSAAPSVEPTRPDAIGRPGASTFTIEGRSAPALFVVGWLATLVGSVAIVVGDHGGPGLARQVLLIGALILSRSGSSPPPARRRSSAGRAGRCRTPGRRRSWSSPRRSRVGFLGIVVGIVFEATSGPIDGPSLGGSRR